MAETQIASSISLALSAAARLAGGRAPLLAAGFGRPVTSGLGGGLGAGLGDALGGGRRRGACLVSRASKPPLRACHREPVASSSRPPQPRSPACVAGLGRRGKSNPETLINCKAVLSNPLGVFQPGSKTAETGRVEAVPAFERGQDHVALKREIRASGGEITGLGAILGLQQRTGRVDQPPAGGDARGGAVEDGGLGLDQGREIPGTESPFRVRVAPPGPAAGAGGGGLGPAGEGAPREAPQKPGTVRRACIACVCSPAASPPRWAAVFAPASDGHHCQYSTDLWSSLVVSSRLWGG